MVLVMIRENFIVMDNADLGYDGSTKGGTEITVCNMTDGGANITYVPWPQASKSAQDTHDSAVAQLDKIITIYNQHYQKWVKARCSTETLARMPAPQYPRSGSLKINIPMMLNIRGNVCWNMRGGGY